jgi:hypothetical protein
LGTPVVIFDQDGIVADPGFGLVRGVKFALDKLEASSPSDEMPRSYILAHAFATCLRLSRA